MSAGVPQMSGSAIQGLVLLAANLNKLARVPSQFATLGAQRLTILVHANTSSGLDAYGKPFAPLAVSTLRRGRQPPPMMDTGSSLGETRFTALGGAGIAMIVGGAYKYHVRSYKTRPARSVAPERAGIPAAWSRVLRDVETSVIHDACPELGRVA